MHIHMMVEFENTEHWLYAHAPDYDLYEAAEAEVLGLGTGTGTVKPVAPQRGLPAKHSAEVATTLAWSKDAPDFRTSVDRSFLRLSELLDYDWTQEVAAGVRASELPLRNYVEALRVWAGLKGLMPHQVRVVFGVVG